MCFRTPNWVLVVLERGKPLVVDLNSSKEDALGVGVPMPARQLEGKVF
jgi:hypothetical protein